MVACAMLVGAVALLQGLNDLAVVDVARMRAALVATVAMSVVSVAMDSILAIGITVSRLGCAKKFKTRTNKIENPLRAAPENHPEHRRLLVQRPAPWGKSHAPEMIWFCVSDGVAI